MTGVYEQNRKVASSPQKSGEHEQSCDDSQQIDHCGAAFGHQTGDHFSEQHDDHQYCEHFEQPSYIAEPDVRLEIRRAHASGVLLVPMIKGRRTTRLADARRVRSRGSTFGTLDFAHCDPSFTATHPLLLNRCHFLAISLDSL